MMIVMQYHMELQNGPWSTEVQKVFSFDTALMINWCRSNGVRNIENVVWRRKNNAGAFAADFLAGLGGA